MRVSILIMAFLPPFRALTSASSARVAASLHWASSSFLSFSRFMASSCSQRSSSARRSASTMARAGLSSESLASLVISSVSVELSKLTLKLPLGGSDGLVDVGEVSQGLVGVSELLLSSTALAVSSLKKSTSLLKTVGNSSGPAVGGDLGVGSSRLGGGLLVHLDLSVTHLEGVLLYGGQHGVVLLVLEHVPVGALSDGPEMGWALVPPLTKVDLAHPVGVKRVTLVRVDDHDEEAGVGVDQLGLVAGLQVPEDGGVVEVGQVDHVLALLELGRVDAANLASLESELLVRHGNGHLDVDVSALHAKLGDVAGLKKTLLVAVGLGVLDPDGSLGIIGLGLVLLLHVHGGP